MKRIIGVFVVGIFKILIPLFYVLFIFSGVACALVTSVIAFQTVKELFPKNATVGIISIPFLVVLSFEVTKVFIIFLNKQYSDSQNEKYIVNKSLFITLRGLLIFISAVFTLLYTFYNLDNPELNSRLNQKKELLNTSFEQQRKDINANYDRQQTAINSSYDNQIQPFKDEMKAQENFRYSNGEFQGPEWKAANQNVQQFNDKRNGALAINENDRTRSLKELGTQSIAAIDSTEKALESDNSSSNKMVNSMLSVVTFNANYSKGLYLATIFILSILISIGLEFVIWASFTVLAINHGDLFKFELDRKIWEEKHSGMTETVDKMNKTDVKSKLKRMTEWADNLFKTAKKKADESVKNAKSELFEIDKDD